MLFYVKKIIIVKNDAEYIMDNYSENNIKEKNMGNAVKKRVFIFVDANDMVSVMTKDLDFDERVIVVRRRTFTYFLFRGCRKILLLVHADLIVNLINLVLYRMPIGCGLRDIHWQKNKEYYIIFGNPTLYPVSPMYLKNLQKQYNVHNVLFLCDTFTPKNSGRLERLGLQYIKEYMESVDFKYIFTFDHENAKKFGWIYHDDLYSSFSISMNKKLKKIKFDICFTGGASRREKELYSVYEYIKKNKVKSIFRMVGASKNYSRYSSEIITTPASYSVVTEEVERSNCILEVIRPGQSGATLRYYEAVCYNKKLLTNNKNVVNLPFYDPRYMKVFEKPEDIDWEWVKERIPVDYHYDGRFSPTHLIDKIIELEEEREKKENGEK